MAVRSISLDKCIGCGTCIVSCPMDVFRLDIIVENRPESSPCSLECPLGLNQRELHNFINLDMLDEGAETLLQRHPMPSITGRICPHPCESECSRNQVDEAININALEQYMGDYALDQELFIQPEGIGEKVAVIGSGPAGLSAAYCLTLSGHQVTVFEKGNKPGGLLRTVIPSFRLSEEVLDKQIAVYQKMGITFKTGIQLGRDTTIQELKQQGYKAFVAATGASKPFGLPVPGSDVKGITSAMSFLEDAKSGQITEIASKVAVIGGGSVALDAARTAIRLGASEVHIICLERLEPGHKDSMLALLPEIEDAQNEGVVIHPSKGVSEFKNNNKQVCALTCVECLSVFDPDGRFNPNYGDVADQKEMEVDAVILAIGQTADPELVPEEFKTSERGYIEADSLTLQVNDDLFGAGDGVTGPSTVVKALASGKRAAIVIDRFLKGEDLTAGLEEKPTIAANPSKEKEIYTAKRIKRSSLSVEKRINNFQETMLVLTDDQAQMEAERCLTCGSRSRIAYLDDCQVCRLCQHYCPTDAIDITDGTMMGSLHAMNIVKLG
jgi:NADPH-dependent glutamate synthase beta subunit-like oxidoreductase